MKSKEKKEIAGEKNDKEKRTPKTVSPLVGVIVITLEAIIIIVIFAIYCRYR